MEKPEDPKRPASSSRRKGPRKTASEAANWAVVSLVIFAMGWIGAAWLRGQEPARVELRPSVRPAPKDPEAAPTPAEAGGDWPNLATKEELVDLGFTLPTAEKIIQARVKRKGFSNLEEMISIAALTPEEAKLARTFRASSEPRDEADE